MSKITLTLDSTQLKDYATCPLAWYYAYQEQLRLIDKFTGAPVASLAADKGTFVHKILDIFYNLRAYMPDSDIFEAGNATLEFFKTTDYAKQFDKDTREFIYKRFIQYVSRYSQDDFRALMRNNVSSVELGFSKILYEDDEKIFIGTGRIDLITEYIGGYQCFVDHKTQDRISNLYSYKPQILTYAWATGFNFGCINYFGLQKEFDGKKTFRRQFISIPQWMIDKWEKKMLKLFNDAYIGLQSPNKEQYFMDRQNEAACGGAFEKNPCMFTHICENEHQEIKESIKRSKYTKHVWKPW